MSGEFRFERLTRVHEKDMVEFAEEFRVEGDDHLDQLIDHPDAFFELADRFEFDRDLPDDRVPMSQYLLFEDDQLVAMSSLRRRLIPVLLLDGGNIGYKVRTTARRRGFAKEVLRQTLDEARGIGLDRVLLTAEDSNLASIRVIENAGGLRDSDSISPRTGNRIRRFWIDL